MEFYTSKEIGRTGWTATAAESYSGYPAANGVDAEDNTRWISGVNQYIGDYYQVNLGSQQSISRIVMVSNQNANGDFPAACNIFISTDGVNWGTAVATVTGNNFIMIDRSFTAKTGQYIRVQITQAKEHLVGCEEFPSFSLRALT